MSLYLEIWHNEYVREEKSCSPLLYCHECKSVCTSLSSSVENHDLAKRCWVWWFSRFTSTTQYNIWITSIIKHLWFLFFVSGSVSVPSVTVVAVASWVRGICKYSASHLSLKHSSATRTEEARRAIAVMVIRPLSQKCLERPPQDREKRQSKSDTHTICKRWPGAGKLTLYKCKYFSILYFHFVACYCISKQLRKSTLFFPTHFIKHNSQNLGV